MANELCAFVRSRKVAPEDSSTLRRAFTIGAAASRFGRHGKQLIIENGNAVIVEFRLQAIESDTAARSIGSGRAGEVALVKRSDFTKKRQNFVGRSIILVAIICGGE